MPMMFVLLGLILLSNVAMLAVAIGALRRARDLVFTVESQLHEFFDAPDEKTPSPFADLVDKSAAIFSARLLSSAQAMLRGSAGGAAKAQASEDNLAAVEANPLLGLLGGKLGKSPLATMALSFLGSKLMGLGAGNNGHVQSSGASGGSSKPWGFAK